MVDTSVMLKVMLSPLIWILIIGVLIIFFVGGLWIRKQRKLEYPCYVIRKTGDGKIDIRAMKAGWFKSKTVFFGLLDRGGEDIMKTGGFRQPVDKIQAGSTIDFHDINGKKGLVCRRKDDDPKILVPLTTIEIENDSVLAKIAGVDLRDASVNIIRAAEKETRNRTQEIVQWIIMGGVIMLVLIVIIMSFQYTQRAQSEAWEKLIQAGNIVKGAAPPITNAP